MLGKLYISKGSKVGGGQISAIQTNIENAQNRISGYEDRIEKLANEKKKKKEFIHSISEEIGNSKSKAEYERQRKDLIRQRNMFLDNAKTQQAEFGDAVIEMFPRLLISKTVNDAKNKINLKIEKNHLPAGVNKRLIAYLLASSTTKCICGAPLCEESRQQILEYKNMLPPKSYTSMYNDFTRMAESWGRGYNRKKIESYISMTLQNKELASGCDRQIHDLDDAEKKSRDIEDLIVARQQAEERVIEIDSLLVSLESEKKKFEIYLKQQMRDFDKATKATIENKRAERRLDIMNSVLKHFSDRLEKESTIYSKRLQDNIQDLLNAMLTSKRSVEVSEDFAVRVTDSFNDESKSEGQFAVVSFAYIGGILKMLRSEEHLSGKEYPLVLDGPFSKLDPDQRQNVVNMIPEFAPQVILFSKDDLQEVFGEERIGYVWTIQSNDEKNVAKVEEGYKWK
ncbi:MAG: hypothetical protein LIO65_09040 [Odoribacter sp.]|nr:hypothetical protein [Odoribacter sp.]